MTRFAELIGHNLVSDAMLRAIQEERVTHAYLFTGPEGVGKLTAAVAFASALNCLNPTETHDACGECSSCKMMDAGTHPDIQIVSPEGAQTKIKQARDMVREANYAPIKGKWKVMIVEQSDTLNDDSSNSILKTLEEPPPYLVIILLSRNPALVLPTIKSRCMIVRFATVPADSLVSALVDRFGADENEAKFLAAYSDGRPGIAISLLGNEKFFEWRGQIIELASKIPLADVRYALRYSEELQKLGPGEKGGKSQRQAMREVLDTLVLWYRDLMSLAIRGNDAELINSDVRDVMTSVSISAEKAAAAIGSLLWARRAIEGNANVQLVSDVLMSKLLTGAK